MPNELAIDYWDEKIAALEVAEATVDGASAKFQIRKELEEAKARRAELLREGSETGELGWEHVDQPLLIAFFKECAQYDEEYFEPLAQGEQVRILEFLERSGFGHRSPSGSFGLTDQGGLFCARRGAIPRSRLHVHVQLEWRSEDGDTLLHPTWGSILFMHREIRSRLGRLFDRSAGNPVERTDFGGETLIHEYPKTAIIEALTNLLIHRDYASDDHGRIKILSDRVEFINPGMSLVSPEDLLEAKEPLEPRYRRNPRIIEAASMARWNQRKGSGILRIRELLARNGSFLDDGSIGLRLWNDEEKERFHLVIYRRDLGQVPVRARTVIEEEVVAPARVAPTKLRHAAATLFGRDQELALLDAAWNDPETHVVTLVAWGGVGKTSLVARWVAGLAGREFDGADYFDWSFYSQGTGDPLRASGATRTGGASADVFVAAALKFFGDAEMAESAASPWDKGARLAQLVAERRALLVLDGLEPLQHPPGPLAGELKDSAVSTLLKGLAAKNPGLCVVTTREPVEDLAPYRETTAPEQPLAHLPVAAGVALLGSLGVQGAEDELVRLVEDVGGHALTLDLLGRFLARAHGGDVRRRDRVALSKADLKTQGGHAFRTMAAYEKWLAAGGEEGERQLAVLRLLGLFDRPADAGCLGALRRKPAITGLTEPLLGLDEEDWNLTVGALAESSLVVSEGSSLDAHPLVREYFGRELRRHRPEAWRAAHGRLFDHLQASAEHQPDTLEGLLPLYQAVGHGCQAGRQQEAFEKVYVERILRGQEAYSTRKLGAIGANLGAVASFFERPWSRVSPALAEADQAWLLNQAAYFLRALGRLGEAVEPMRAGLEGAASLKEWKNSAIYASNLSELELTLGDVDGAVRDAEQSADFADRGDDTFWRMGARTTLADSLHQSGRRDDALSRFREAESMQVKRQAACPLLYSQQGFLYCDLLLADPERAAWQTSSAAVIEAGGGKSRQDAGAASGLARTCRDVEERAAKTLPIAERSNWLLDIALDHLTLGRAGLYRAILGRPDPTEELEESATEKPRIEIEQAVDGLRRAGTLHELPRGLLTRAWLRALTGDRDGTRRDLDEAWAIAERGPMPLFQADVQLHRARLFGDRAALAEARRLIEKHGYGRRREELEDAEEAAKRW